MFTIEYPSGTDWRQEILHMFMFYNLYRVSIFQFMVSDDHPETKVSYFGERPNLQYVSFIYLFFFVLDIKFLIPFFIIEFPSYWTMHWTASV